MINFTLFMNKFPSFSLLNLSCFLTGFIVLLSACKTTSPVSEEADKSTRQIGFSSTPIGEITIGFYNVENLFDAEDDPSTADGDFLPQGRYNWTEEKYQEKLKRIAHVISQLGDSDGPEILGLAEIENKEVMEDLVAQSSISGKYSFIQEDSPDPRGIDVALMYDPEIFMLEYKESIRVEFPENPDIKTRDILFVQGTIADEPITFVVNHWPSRRNGQVETEPKRLLVANKVRDKLDELMEEDGESNIILMGDFNDDPINKSIKEVIGAKTNVNKVKEDGFYNATAGLLDRNTSGTLTFRGEWNLFDQFLVSEDLLHTPGKIKYVSRSASIYNPEFLRVGGSSRAKNNPRRGIFRGDFQERGYSDHFPVYLKLIIN